MFPRIDLFSKGEGDHIRWIASFGTMEEARNFLVQNPPAKPTTYVAHDAQSGEQQELTLELQLRPK